MAIWLQIAWKESREQVWRMIAVATIALSVQCYLLVAYPDDGGQASVASLCLVPGALFIAMGVAAGERTAGGLEFLRSLPAARWKWAAARLLAGAMAVLLPLVAIVLLQLLAGGPSKVGGPSFSQIAPFGALFSLSVYLWAVAAGVDRSSELRAGVAAVCLFVGWLALTLAVYTLKVFLPSLSRMYEIVVLFGPAGAFRLTDSTATAKDFAPWRLYLPQVLALTGTALWSVQRYGRMSAGDSRSAAATSPDRLVPTALRPCRRSPRVAIAWKEYREARPICLAGLAILAALVLPILMGAAWDEGSQVFAEATVFVLLLGTIMALVLGVGGHAGDLEPRVWQFWRSRPIAPAGWFWIKYLTGAGVLLVSFDGATTLIDLLVGGPALLLRDPFWWGGPVLHLFAYSTAVWMVCQLRQPIYAGILSLGLVMAVVLLGDPYHSPSLPFLGFLNVVRTCPRQGSSFPIVVDWLTSTYLPFAATMVALSSFLAVLASVAVDGRLSRRRLFGRGRPGPA